VIYKGAKPRSADDRYRLLKVAIRDNETRGTILKNAHMLKDSSKAVHKKVGIVKDLTRTQREHNKVLRQKLNKMKKDFPNKKWAIRRDKVIELPGAPLKGGTAGIFPNRAVARGPPTGSAKGGGIK
jgi:hypothetical protein